MALQNPEQLKLLKPDKPPKYHNAVFKDDQGVLWHSKAEYRRWQLLKALESADNVRNLRRQVSFSLDVNGDKICRYVADFTYDECHDGVWVPVVEDVKSKATKTRLYALKKKLMWTCHKVDIREIER